MAETDPNVVREARRKRAQKFMKDAAEKMAQLEKSQTEMTATLVSLKTENDTLKQLVKDLNVKDLIAEVERLKAGHTQVMRAIQRSGSAAINIPGSEDLAPKFSLLRAIVSVKSGGKLFAESEEYKLMKEAKVKASQVIGVDSDGGWFIPDQVIPDVIASIYRKSVFLDLAGDGATRVSVIDGLTGASVRIPKFKKGVIAYWQGELDDATVSKVGTGEMNMKPRKINVLTRVTEEMQRFQAYGFENLLRQDMVRAMAEKVDYTIAYGTGAGDMPEGLTKMLPAGQKYAAGGNAAVMAKLDYSGLGAMDLIVENQDLTEDSTKATISSPAYFRFLSDLRVLNYAGQAAADADYLVGLPPLTRARLTEIIGAWDKTTMIPSNKNVGDGNAKCSDVFRGNFGELLVGRWSGIEVVTEGNYDIVNDTRLVKLRAYMDFGMRYAGAITWCPNAQSVA